MGRVNQDEKATISMQQSLEWGTRIMQACFPRIKDRFTWEVRGEREVYLTLIVHLYNLRANLVHMNLIQYIFLPKLYQENDLDHVANLCASKNTEVSLFLSPKSNKNNNKSKS